MAPTLTHMAKILILEDDENRVEIFREMLGQRHDLTVVDTAQDAIDEIDSDIFDVIFLDHDLGGQTYVAASDMNTGSEVVRNMTRRAVVLSASVVIHSMNTPAAASMQSQLVNAGYHPVHRIPFSKLVSFLDDPGFIV